MSVNNHCRREQLEQLLTESLPEYQERELSEHLSSCTLCQQELESLAGTQQWWSETSRRLRSRAPIGTESFGDPAEDEDAPQFVADFAVDFLEPGGAGVLGRLGDYEIHEIIGRGGMGIVLKGFQAELHRHVAVKVLAPHLAVSGAARRRFAREAQATAAVVHPHVMAIHSVNAAAKLPYLVMPYISCVSLQDRLDRQGPLELKDILRIGMQAALGLAAAHAQGLVHRDVKPANILLETNVDRVLLTDFGLARAVDDATLTRTGIIAGTPQYMSPEQANGDPVDHRSDLFSLGAVLYAMCTGRPPFRAETTFGVLRKIRETAPRSIREVNSEIPSWLERIVLRLLSKSVDDRPSSATAVAELLEQCLAHVQQPTAFPLPEGIGDWKLHPPCNEFAALPHRQRWPARNVRRIALAALFVATLILIASQYRPQGNPVPSNRTSSPGAQRRPPQPTEPTTASMSPETPPGWDDAQADLDRVAEDLDQFEQSLLPIPD